MKPDWQYCSILFCIYLFDPLVCTRWSVHWKWLSSERPRWRRPEISRLALRHPEWRLRGISGDQWRPALALAARPADWGSGTFPSALPAVRAEQKICCIARTRAQFGAKVANNAPLPPQQTTSGGFEAVGAGTCQVGLEVRVAVGHHHLDQHRDGGKRGSLANSSTN